MGLNDNEVSQSRKKYGSNNITEHKKNTFWQLLLESFGDPIIKILLIALAIKILLLFQSFDWYETVGILIAIVYKKNRLKLNVGFIVIIVLRKLLLVILSWGMWLLFPVVIKYRPMVLLLMGL